MKWFTPNAFFLPFERCYMILQWYLHTTYTFCIIYRLWRWHSWSYFYFACSRSLIWRKKGQIWKKMFLKVERHRVHRVLFFPSLYTTSVLHTRFRICNYIERFFGRFGSNQVDCTEKAPNHMSLDWVCFETNWKKAGINSVEVKQTGRGSCNRKMESELWVIYW